MDAQAAAVERSRGRDDSAGAGHSLKSRDRGGNSLWAYRCGLAGRGSKRVQHGGFATESDARAALALALERARRERGTPTRSLTLTELVDEYLAQRDVEPTTLGKLR